MIKVYGKWWWRMSQLMEMTDDENGWQRLMMMMTNYDFYNDWRQLLLMVMTDADDDS